MLHQSLLLFLLSTVLVLQLGRLSVPAAAAPLEKRGSDDGEASFYYQGGATGACGQVHGDDDYIVALSPDHFSGNNPCGNKVTVTATSGAGKGRSVDVTVVDKCMGCTTKHIDLAVGPFKYLAAGDGLGVGIISVSLA